MATFFLKMSVKTGWKNTANFCVSWTRVKNAFLLKQPGLTVTHLRLTELYKQRWTRSESCLQTWCSCWQCSADRRDKMVYFKWEITPRECYMDPFQPHRDVSALVWKVLPGHRPPQENEYKQYVHTERGNNTTVLFKNMRIQTERFQSFISEQTELWDLLDCIKSYCFPLSSLL